MSVGRAFLLAVAALTVAMVATLTLPALAGSPGLLGKGDCTPPCKAMGDSQGSSGILLLSDDEDEYEDYEDGMYEGRVAEEREYKEEGEEKDKYGGEGEELGEALGEAAWSLGIPLIAGFVVYKHAYPRLARRGIRIPLKPVWATRIHATTSFALGTAALLHGALLIGYAGPLEYTAAGMTMLTLAFGAVLYLARGRVRGYPRLLWVKRIIAILTLIAVTVHIAMMD